MSLNAQEMPASSDLQRASCGRLRRIHSNLFLGLVPAIVAALTSSHSFLNVPSSFATVGCTGYVTQVRRREGGYDAPGSSSVHQQRNSDARSASLVVRRVVAEPPTRMRPPQVGDDVAVDAGEWTECVLEDRGRGSSVESAEWSIAEGARPGAASAASATSEVFAALEDSGKERRSPSFVEVWVLRTADYGDFERLLKLRSYDPSRVSLNCRVRSIDAEVSCNECIRLLRGGHYGTLGIVVPAYPPQRSAVGCLQLSKTLEVEAKFESWGSPVSLGELGNEQRQSAFCNSVNVQMTRVP